MSHDKDPENLPPVQMAELDPATLDQLFSDVGAAAELLEVVVKGGAEAYATGGVLTLADARDALVSGGASGVQLRYRHGGREWWDTLMRTPETVRLVRIERG